MPFPHHSMTHEEQGAICNAVLAPYASKPSETKGRYHAEKESKRRSPFERDRDRVIHSKAFRRLQYKTQVFVRHEGDHYRTRLTHSLEVAQVSRSLARSLRLNEDLAETIALAHDLGHPPFAHVGEDSILECLKEIGAPTNLFNHNEQSFRLLTELEESYPDFNGLNLTWETLEGIAKHNGPLDINRTDGYLAYICQYSKNFNLLPSLQPSAEAQVADAADGIAYNSHDLDDGLRSGMFTIEDLKEVGFIQPIVNDIIHRYPDINNKQYIAEILREVMGAMINDILKTSFEKIQEIKATSVDDIRYYSGPVVLFSKEFQDHDKDLRKFLKERMYKSHILEESRKVAAKKIRELFFAFYKKPELMPSQWFRKIHEGNKLNIVLDYISGMTDNYALEEHKRVCL